MITLNFRSNDSEEIAIAKRYFAMDNVGRFKENVADLLPFKEITKVSQLATLMRNIVQALDNNQQCPMCGEFEEISSRTQAKKVYQVMRNPCASCLKKQQEKLFTERQQGAIRLKEHIDALVSVHAAMTVECMALPDDIVLLLLALDRAINPRLAAGAFRRDDCSALAPAYVSNFIDKIRGARAIVDHPNLAKSDAYVLEDGKLYHYPNRLVYKLVTDPTVGTGDDLLRLLETKELTDNVAIRNLWLDYATADCMAYLFNQCEQHGLPTDQELNEKIYSAIRVALVKYSVAQLWNLIWKIVRDAATLSTREFYNRPKAAGTIPGKLQRYLEKVQRGDVSPLKDWWRPDAQPAGTLGHIFLEFYSIDENTAGADVMAMFADSNTSDNITESSSEALHSAANRFVTAALANDIATNALICLADGIREGLELEDAINQVFELLPILDEPF